MISSRKVSVLPNGRLPSPCESAPLRRCGARCRCTASTRSNSPAVLPSEWFEGVWMVRAMGFALPTWRTRRYTVVQLPAEIDTSNADGVRERLLTELDASAG